ncbi:arginine-binding periplasmic protein [Legionella geestiana]|uniref:Arginine-binding periplasmic protein n=1 Tax=Legionella geestiana TaxID=45065 RepID=A0A0W0TNL4_9GAMM|nr:transporter substrate-binding domain-containing protein [Legionella geestiana]KTC97101.1 arginine-binding periplasmic protein [Legionella geestiana]QBS11458.1 transporter substrate-binding domain-containing protein [Legionella geestiana]QDQ39018.1 transporter substrate-binding domain-containing protein [Legionella geestiana]STX53881.1 arginine-binding periplasmic protein [Legionella geestiana]
MKHAWKRFISLWVACLCASTMAHADLKVGVMFFDPPLVMSANQGFHVDLANKICQGLQEKCVIVPMVWEELFTALDNGKIDLIMGVFPTPERVQKYLFSIPYLPSNGRIIVLSRLAIDRVTQLKGQEVGILREETGAGVFAEYVQAAFPGLFQVIKYKDIETLLESLADDTVQAALLHETAVNYWVANSRGIFSMLGNPFPLGGGYSIMTLPNSQALITRIDAQIRLLKSNGVFDKLYSTYFGGFPGDGSPKT